MARRSIESLFDDFLRSSDDEFLPLLFLFALPISIFCMIWTKCRGIFQLFSHPDLKYPTQE